jgi:hypothetical protein
VYHVPSKPSTPSLRQYKVGTSCTHPKHFIEASFPLFSCFLTIQPGSPSCLDPIMRISIEGIGLGPYKSATVMFLHVCLA